MVIVAGIPHPTSAAPWIGTQSRRLSFSGSGPGDALLLASDEIPATGGGFPGRIARLIVYRRALAGEEIAKLAGP